MRGKAGIACGQLIKIWCLNLIITITAKHLRIVLIGHNEKNILRFDHWFFQFVHVIYLNIRETTSKQTMTVEYQVANYQAMRDTNANA